MTTPGLPGPNPVGPRQPYPGSTTPISHDPKSVDQLHQNSDLDANRFSQHHSLGPTPNQASPGHHVHDGALSKQIPGTSILPLDSGFATYSLGWTASTTNPTIGNGVLRGKFMQLGKLILFSFEVIFGSTTTAGSGNYSFSLPVAPINDAGPFFTCYGVAQNGSNRWVCTGWIDPAVGNVFRMPFNKDVGTNGLNGNGLAAAWGAGDFIRGSGFYEAAVSA